jgi:hypothetical protein
MTTEVLGRIGRVARERVDSLQRESTALPGDTEGFLIFARENCSFVLLLLLIWQVLKERLRVGGIPANVFVQECDLFLNLAGPSESFLTGMVKDWNKRELPEEIAAPLFSEVQMARSLLVSLAQKARHLREEVSKPSRVSVDPEQLKRRVKQADEGQEWLALRHVLGPTRPAGPSGQE